LAPHAMLPSIYVLSLLWEALSDPPTPNRLMHQPYTLRWHASLLYYWWFYASLIPPLGQNLSALALLTILSQGCPVHNMVFCRIPDLSPPDANNIPTLKLTQPEMSPDTEIFSWGQKHLQVRIAVSDHGLPRAWGWALSMSVSLAPTAVLGQVQVRS
jgi:hypothetical protein